MVELRQVGPDDWPLWRDVRLQALTEAPHAFSSSLSEWRGKGDTETRWRSRLEAVPFNLVAVAGERAVWQVSGTAVNADGHVELISLWTAPQVRGQGVGAALIAGVLRWADDQDASAVVLAVKRSNTPALAAYERAGFRATGPAEAADEVRMVRVLGQ
jgi:ribosomal protein S18 acetylase RimI-like enzyme